MIQLNGRKLILSLLLRDYATVMIQRIIAGEKNGEGERGGGGKSPYTYKNVRTFLRYKIKDCPVAAP